MKRLNEEQNKRLKGVLKSAAIIFVIGIAYYLFVKITHLGIPCVFNLITGLHCPGCGISRMFISLFALDFKDAFGYNAFVLLIGPVAAIFVLRHYIIYILKGTQKSDKLETVLLIIAIILAIAFGVLRNIPTFSFLAP
ncbi:MAG: DUF2752 domain-containing protein [Clostridia bacterium]|nr:DUF2752 domain-containing protein [Clostridia bacterium]